MAAVASSQGRTLFMGSTRSPKNVQKVEFECIPDLVSPDFAVALALQARDAAVRNAARNDQVEEIEVRVEVEGQSVHGHPSAAFDANRTDFAGGESGLGIHPDTGEARDSAGRYTPV